MLDWLLILRYEFHLVMVLVGNDLMDMADDVLGGVAQESYVQDLIGFGDEENVERVV